LKAKLARELLKHEEDGDDRGGLVGATPSFFSIFDRDERDFTLGQAFAELFKNPILYLYSAMDDDEADPEEGFLQACVFWKMQGEDRVLPILPPARPW